MGALFEITGVSALCINHVQLLFHRLIYPAKTLQTTQASFSSFYLKMCFGQC